MAATRASGKRKVFGSDDEDTTHVSVPAAKRKSKEISRDEEASDSDSDEQPAETSSKKRKVDQKNRATKDSKLVIRNTRPVVEIPAMTSSPVVKPRSPRSPAKKVHKPEIVEISSDEEDGGKEDEEAGDEEAQETANGGDIEGGMEEIVGQELISEANQEQSVDEIADKKQNGSFATEIEGEAESNSDEKSELEADDRKENIASRNGSKPSTTLLLQKALPTLLPMELFDDDDTPAATNIRPHQVQVKPKKIKFTDIVEPVPKDRRLGSTTFRVSKKQNPKLAPKASHQARSTKEMWLQGRVGKSVGNNRKPFKKGFFISKK